MRPPDDLKEWSKNDLVREVRRLRAILREHSERPGDDPRPASTPDPIIGGSPYGHGDALLDTRASVLLEGIDVALIDAHTETESVRMFLTLSGRVNYSEDRVTHAYQLNGDGAAGIVTELVQLASRAAQMTDHPGEQEFAADFKVALEERMKGDG